MEPVAKELNLSLVDPQDDSQIEVINSGTNRNRVYSSHEGMFIHKPENERELENFGIIEKYRAKLAESGVCFPLLVSIHESDKGESKKMIMASFPYFQPYNIEEHFGKFKIVDEESVMRAYLKSLRTIAEVIPASEFAGRKEDEEGLGGTIEMLGKFSDYIKKDTDKIVPYESFYEVIEKTQAGLGEMDFVAHKDANPSNWRAVLINDKIFINFIDLETLGCARPGWDEGRAFVLFSLDPNKQRLMLEIMKDDQIFQDENTMTYFWRVVVLRSLRELYLLRNGKYDESFRSHISDETESEELKEKVVNSILESLKTGLEEINKKI